MRGGGRGERTLAARAVGPELRRGNGFLFLSITHKVLRKPRQNPAFQVEHARADAPLDEDFAVAGASDRDGPSAKSGATGMSPAGMPDPTERLCPATTWTAMRIRLG